MPIQTEVVPSGEALCAVPNTLVALCLNTSGLDRVRNADALSCFIPMFTTRTYLKALSGDTPSILGSGLDELMRHVPNLRLVCLLCHAAIPPWEDMHMMAPCCGHLSYPTQASATIARHRQMKQALQSAWWQSLATAGF